MDTKEKASAEQNVPTNSRRRFLLKVAWGKWQGGGVIILW